MPLFMPVERNPLEPSETFGLAVVGAAALWICLPNKPNAASKVFEAVDSSRPVDLEISFTMPLVS